VVGRARELQCEAVPLVLRVAEDLKIVKATIGDFFLTYV